MKKIFKLFLVVLGLVTILSSCSSSRNPSSAQHNRGVNNRHFSGY
ncbi:MAG: hypothetical protein ABI374_09215 [Ginsengibacter sp.]